MADKQSTEFPFESNCNVFPNSKAQPIMSLIISNVGGPNAEKGSANRRKRAIAGVLNTFHPTLVLFQEFPWSGIQKYSTWKNINIPDKYEYYGHSQASILCDENELIAKIINPTELIRLHDKMTRKGKLPMGFSPLERMCILEIETKVVPMAHFLCISWHGSHNSKKKTDLINELKNLLVFIEEFGRIKELPFIIAGDFNLLYEKACAEIDQLTVTIYDYTPMERRKGRLIDFYIASKALPLANIASIDWETVEDGKDATEIFDHDPVIATLTTNKSFQMHYGNENNECVVGFLILFLTVVLLWKHNS